MSAAKKKPKTGKSRNRLATAAHAPAFVNAPSPLLAAPAITLFFARFLTITEGAEQGETLWITQCWLFLALLWIFDALRRGSLRIRFDRLDVAVGVLAGGHVISAISVLTTAGHKRAAINMLWEWVGLAVSYVLIRQIVRTRIDVRRFLWCMCSVAAVLAAFGLYQHYVLLPRLAADYRGKREKLDKLLAAEPGPGLRKQIRELQSELPPESLEADGSARKSFESRLLSSKEPLGKFALANTFAGVLCVAAIVLIAVCAAAINRRRPWWEIAGAAVAVALVMLCLLLTKSRTAWVGCIAGVAIGIWFSRRSRSSSQAVITRWCVVSVGAIALITVIAAVTGGIDRKTISESPKSLRYRLQYWTGTVAVLREHPVFGTGPGNFRQQYLKHKAPESSEEIRDPHNLILGAWVSGGLMAMLGLVGVIAIGVSSARKSHREQPPEEEAASDAAETHDGEHSTYSTMTWVTGTLGGFLVVVGANAIVFVETLSWDLPILAAGSLFFLWLTLKAFANAAISVAMIIGAWAALLVHLCGAGGMEYPAIVQLLLVLPALLTVMSTSPQVKPSQTSVESEARVPLLIWLAAAATVIGVCLLTATLPVMARKLYTAAGDAEGHERGRVKSARSFYILAAKADPFSPDPPARLAQLSYAEWRFRGHNKAAFENAVDFQQGSIELDPNRSANYRVLGKWFAARFADSGARTDAERAVELYRESLKRYPNHSATVAEFSILLHEVGTTFHSEEERSESKTAARTAIELDEINREQGHTDRVLPMRIRSRLNEIDQQ